MESLAVVHNEQVLDENNVKVFKRDAILLLLTVMKWRVYTFFFGRSPTPQKKFRIAEQPNKNVVDCFEPLLEKLFVDQLHRSI